MSQDGSVTSWIAGMKLGDPSAAQAVWQRYFPQLVRLARERLAGVSRRAADEEDVALSALATFCRATEQGRFPDLADRNGLWQLLLRITACKAVALVRRETRQRRGSGRVRGDSVWALAQVVGESPTPEFAATMAEQCQRLLGLLGDCELRALAIAKMEGYTNEEIAEQLGCSLRTVERRLRLVRKKWESETTP